MNSSDGNRFSLGLAGALALGGMVALASLWGGCAADEVNTNGSSSGTATGTGTGTGTPTGTSECGPGTVMCNGTCTVTDFDPNNCGGCGTVCDPGQVCSQGQCGTQCAGGTVQCGELCVDTSSNTNFCGDCNTACDPGDLCVNSVCQSSCPLTVCDDTCVDTNTNPAYCGDCDTACGAGQVCVSGLCSDDCGPGLFECNGECVNLNTSEQYCGDCNTTCSPGEDCVGGVCDICDSNTTDCDGDGWMGSEGDCCDKTGGCGLEPELVNPGAIEVVGNGIDDNCNGLTDLFDTEDTIPCDQGLASDSSTASDYANALGICRTTTENPADPVDRTWGLIDAQLVRADGTVLDDARARSIRTSFGNVNPATLEGQSVVVLSSGIASDATQTNPGPNGGPGSGNVSTSHTPGSMADISTCADPKCISDWFNASNPPLKNPGELNAAPNCGDPAAGPPEQANDSAMLYLRLRTPTNAKAFSFNSYFFSAEYPEFVCTTFNDQFVALVDTPQPTLPVPNPPDKNLLVYNDGADKWPIGINVAAGTALFSVCNAADIPNQCQTAEVDPASCFLGVGQLAGTGFENSGGCTIGGGTFWLTTSGNIIPGDILELRIAIWDVGDTAFDSLAILDGFTWLSAATVPGTDG